MNDKYEVVKFLDDKFELDVRIDGKNDTVWLKVEETASLFDVNRPAVVKHVSNVLKDKELDTSTCSILEQVQIERILASINQTAFGIDVYKSLEEKAVNLLYFIIKNHPFIDGCKRIAAGLFILYLSKNALLSNNKLTISNGTLTAITLLVAESNPLEKEIMIKVIMNIVFKKM